jgi:serine/threonine protein kinase
MPLTSGTKLGPYEIQSPLGAGGMGEVYRASDTRLDRVVAIKVLAPHLSSSPELKQRMEREARAISALNHPNICQLFDIGSQNGTDYLVMEFLDGETLAKRLAKGPMPLNEILRIGIAVAEALEVAHRKGIVHRDLKPGNIMLPHSGLTQSGAKLMDFGLAKAMGTPVSGAGSGTPPSFTASATLASPSLLSPLTTAGSIVGTIQYMSPEQIEGKEADRRCDIFALGAVLYEMAAGKRPFEGKSQLSLASSILEKDAEPISAINPSVPPAFEHVLATCLQKNPEERFQTAHDVKLELQWIASGRSVPARPASPLPSSNKRARLGWAAAVLAAIILGAAGGLFFYHPTQAAHAVRTVINPPEKATLNLTGDFAGPPVLSPDGMLIAFAATGGDGKTALWVRPMDSLDTRPLPGTESAIFPFWSPDSRSLGFFADSKLKTVDLNNGSPQVVADAPFGRGGSWSSDGVILFSGNTQTALTRVSANGGTLTTATKIDPTQHTSHRWPFFLPDGQHFLYLAINHDPSRSANNVVYYASLDGRENRPVLRSQSNAVYGDGFLLFSRGDQLMAQPFDPAKGTLRDEPRGVARGVMNDISTWHMDATASPDGLLAFGSGGSSDLQLIWVDREGKPLDTLADKLTNLQTARISPQGDRVALQIDTGQNDIWVLDLVRGVRTRLTFGNASSTFPVWSPDGKWIAYCSDRNGRSNLYRKPSDGSGAEEVLLTDDPALRPDDWSRDGKYLLYSRGGGIDAELWTLPLEGERKPWLVIPHAAVQFSSRLSPDGRWLAYSSNESGVVELYVVPFRGGQGKWQLTALGGVQPKWGRDGRQLYFMDPSYNLFTVPVKDVGNALQFGPPQRLVSSSSWSAPQVFYDVTPDGKKILLNRVAQQVSQSITVVTNFTAGLKK